MDWVWSVVGNPNRLDRPYHMAVDDQGNVYVEDGRNNRIQKFDSNGGFMTMWGRYGNGDGEYELMGDNGGEHVGGVAVDKQGRVFVDDNTGRVQVFDAGGRFLGKWGSKGSGPGQLRGASGMALDSQGSFP